MAEPKMQKIAVVTGATSGIGTALAHQLARERYKLVIPCRDAGKAASLRAGMLIHCPRVQTDFIPCDLEDLLSVRRCAEAIRQRYPIIELLICNAGILLRRAKRSNQGIESTFAVNHLAHFVLVAWLLPNLYRRSRIVITSSNAHYKGNPDFLEDINYNKHTFKAYKAYANSKLANTIFACTLARLLQDREIACNSVHPGLIATNLVSNSSLLAKLAVTLFSGIVLKQAEEGAAPLCRLALDAEAGGFSGKFFFKMKEAAPHPAALDHQVQKQLWQASLRLASSYLPKDLDDLLQAETRDQVMVDV